MVFVGIDIEKLQSVGLKVTKSRLLVLQVLTQLGGHQSADDIYKALIERGEGLPRGTVFKIVGDLSRNGVLMMADAGPGRTLYEYTDVWHHHFVCRRCSKIMDVPCVEGRKPCLLPDEPVSGWIDEAQIIFRGICDECRSLPQENGEIPLPLGHLH